MNKFFKKIGAALCGVLVAAGLSGCMYIGLGVELKSNNTGTVFLSYGMSSDYCTEEDFADAEYEVKHFTVNGKDYIGYDVTEEYSSYEELSADLTTLSENGTSLFTSVKAEKKGSLFVSKYTFDAVMPPLMGDDAGEYAGMASDMIAVDFTLKMPGAVKYCEGGSIGDDGSITFLVDPAKECTFSCESSEVNFASIFIAAGVVLVVIGVIAVASKKKDN
ncbi:MAG: hypothetical protein ACI4J0_01395 [Huintestinicola sp.]|uniref:hypothetical protein n=1 Tax=Huintestinicola sp. TaxID=2981661 RepID=UPI003F125302